MATSDKTGDKTPAIEILHWQAAHAVTHTQMAAAMQGIVEDLKTLPGFQYQASGVQTSAEHDERWVAVYLWDSEADAHQSNELMADTASFAALLALIQPDSITMTVLPVLQQSTSLATAH